MELFQKRAIADIVLTVKADLFLITIYYLKSHEETDNNRF